MDIETVEQEVLRRLNDASVRTEKLLSPWQAGPHAFMDAFYALITEHRATKAELEAFRREVSEAAEKAQKMIELYAGEYAAKFLARFIIPQADPLHECLEEALARTGEDLTEHTERLRAALATRGLELVKKEPSQ